MARTTERWEVPTDALGPSPTAYAVSRSRGTLLAALAAAVVLVAVVALLSPVAAILLLALAAAAAALALHPRRGVVAASAREWPAAVAASGVLAVRLRSLRRQRARLLAQLGAATYSGDDAEASYLRDCIDGVAARIEQLEERRGRRLGRARAQVRLERVASDETAVVPPERGLMGDPGFEPGTSALSERRSNQLS